MGFLALLTSLVAAVSLLAQTPSPCAGTPAYSPCDIPFELNGQETAAHPNPYLTVTMHAEFRSPRHRTFLMPAFWDGGNRLVIRFTPTEPGDWDYRVTSNIARLNGGTGAFTAKESDAPGFIRAANVHHFAYTDGNRPHLWMGDTSYRFAFLDKAAFENLVDVRAQQKFNHMRGIVIGSPEDAPRVFNGADHPNPEHFRHVDECLRYLNTKGLVADLLLAGDGNALAKLFPTWQQRERYVRYLVARYAPFNITWQGIQRFEDYENGRELLKEIGALLQKMDPYHHLRSSDARDTSAPLLEDGWMDYITYGTPEDAVGAIEHQLYARPQMNAGFAKEGVDTDSFRRRLWNATMNGQYPGLGNPGAHDSPAAKQAAIWHEFYAGTRHWELEPYFDVDGGRALALEGVEYIVYVEKPSGPVEVLVEKHGYDVHWFNPVNGEWVKMKDYKGERFTGEAPDRSHDWVLLISRESHKEGMLRSYKFESRRIVLQEVEQSTAKVPYEIEQPAQDTLPVSKPVPYAAKIKRDTRATRSMLWLWTGEVAADGHGYRVLGAGQKGTFEVPAGIARQYPAVLHVRLAAMNANGKVYTLDRTYGITR